MPNNFSGFGYLKKSGDTMSGDLNMGGNNIVAPNLIDSFGMNGDLDVNGYDIQNPTLIDGFTSNGNVNIGAGSDLILSPTSELTNNGMARTKLYKSTNQLISSGANRNVTWDGINFYNKFSDIPATNPIIPETGFYNIYVQLLFEYQTTGIRRVEIYKGATLIARKVQEANLIVSTYIDASILGYYFAQGETVNVLAYQDIGSDLNILLGSHSSHLYIERVG